MEGFEKFGGFVWGRWSGVRGLGVGVRSFRGVFVEMDLASF